MVTIVHSLIRATGQPKMPPGFSTASVECGARHSIGTASIVTQCVIRHMKRFTEFKFIMEKVQFCIDYFCKIKLYVELTIPIIHYATIKPNMAPTRSEMCRNLPCTDTGTLVCQGQSGHPRSGKKINELSPRGKMQQMICQTRF